jgi:hypothetical protein
MPRPVDLSKVKSKAVNSLNLSIARYEGASKANLPYGSLRWIAAMTAVEVHAVWERYVEHRLVAALNHHPETFLAENGVKGIKLVSSGLAAYLVRGGAKYFDFRSTSELFDKGDHLVGKGNNPFRQLKKRERDYLDALAAIRNHVVHRSAASAVAYRRALERVYSSKSKPQVEEFLNAKDFRASSPARYKSRLRGLVVIVKAAIHDT